MKKLLLFSFVFMMLVASVSAVEWDNTKDFDDSSNTITIKNSFLRIFDLDTVATIKLNTPRYYSVIAGENRLVMEWEVDSRADEYPDFLKQMDALNLNTGQYELKQFYYRIAIYSDENISITEQRCTYDTLKNGSLEADVCWNQVVGSHIRQKKSWKLLDIKAPLPRGVHTIGVFTDVHPGDTYDGIPTMFGLRIPEFAVWTDSLNDEIVAYWKMDLGTPNTFMLDSVNGTNNGSFCGSPVFTI